ncbi:MAG: DUF5018 domain-containing protein [Bacteroidales bacterium]|nr:DUF5018 domain-containing protein [Bacteroidales bacterium]
MTGSSGTATIPGQGAGAVVKYYAFSSTIGSITNNFDLFTIKLNNNTGNFYSYIVSGLSTQAEILSFTMAEQVAPAVINPLAATITLEVNPTTPLTALSPVISVSAGATINPASGVIRDFTNPVSYTVTAEDGTTTKEWTVTVTNAVPNYGLLDDDGVNLPTITYWYTGQGSDITQKGTEFNTTDLGPLSSLFIRGSAFKTYKNGTGDVAGAQFRYKVWSTTGTEPDTYTTRNVNWTSNDGGGNQTWAGFGDQIVITDGLVAGTYNLKIFFTISGTGIAGDTEDGPFSATFQVQEFSTEAEILDFTLTEQTGPAVINTGDATVTVEVTNGTSLTSLIPAISVSAGATIDPLSGVEQDFTTPVIYTVTSESGSTKSWTVTVNEEAPPSITWANLQWPADGNITLNQSFNVYAQVYAESITNIAGQGAGIQAWIGYSTDNTDPGTWTNWIAASFQGDNGNNDEYLADLGAAIGTAGIYYYASRFQLDEQAFVYGGFQGGFWDGVNFVSGTLTVNPPLSKTLTLNVLLEGLYNSNGQMNQANGDSGPQFGPGIADEITVELHNENDYSITELSFNGVALGTDGSATVSVPANTSGNYYVTIRHRNSIATTSVSAISFSNQSILCDFSQPANVYGSNLLQTTDGWYVIFGGDVNQDGVIDTGDVTPLDNDQFNYLTGYVDTDANGDGSVDTGDITIVDNNQFNYIASLTP